MIEASFENISNLFIQLKKFSFNAVVCCGYMQKPELDLNKITEDSLNILAPIIKNFDFGDEAVFLSILSETVWQEVKDNKTKITVKIMRKFFIFYNF